MIFYLFPSGNAMFHLTPGGSRMISISWCTQNFFKSFWMALKQNSMFSSSAREPKCNYLHSCNDTSKEIWLFLGSQVHGEGIPALMSSASMEMQDWPLPCCLVDGCSILTNRLDFTVGNSRYGYTILSGNAARWGRVELKAKVRLHLPTQTPKRLPPNSYL